ncbi:MAG: GNAT family N-acetyltransferase [Lachnospiraceae bacterium]|nr:GNAT family N-acetyltransferase [Lachnospiraceae bacterium]
MGHLRFPLVTDHLILQPDNEEKIWSEPWSVRLKGGSQETIGMLSMAGAQIAGEVPIRVELEPAYRDQGYGREIFYFMAKFVFRFRNLKEISAVCEHENDRCVHALEKAGYVLREHKSGLDYYSMKKPKTAWTGLYLSVGVCAGLILGITFSNLWAGIVTGVLAGITLGILLDRREKK